ncbi:hypothetical protein AQ490_13080 [Wenjunlia vitaminophila]|uniref:Protein kinase domain-containing protein n=1 Tax=Wenjunlia vitaminophila TaxID=76728 RepID=A0A0T6LY32_WENVI|nr:serine/threonine-protein kinase [Wenjunlia vitaminophila]KRV50880.1 hypothetical protein AQ490_13080 [Wenjunlia vitaminophila]
MERLGPDDPGRIGDYRLLRRLGVGGMGRVYLGRTAGGRTVAVKVVRSELADDTEFRARFRQEVAAARRVGGAWTAQVLDADTEGPRPWVATGYVAGPALHQAVAEFGPLPAESVRALVAGLAETLAAVHGMDLVHRDVKPSNVILAVDGPRLIDFGIARALDATASLTRSGIVVGSPGYMSPEQVLGNPVGAETDVFSLGAVLAFAALGRGPFPGSNTAAMLYKVAHEEPELGDLDGALRTVARECLRKEPERRPKPAEVVRALTGQESAAALFPTGWLPQAVVTSLGRKAVELLDLDDEGAAPVPAAPPGGVTGQFGPPPRWDASGPQDEVPGTGPRPPGPPGPAVSAAGVAAAPTQPWTARRPTPPPVPHTDGASRQEPGGTRRRRGRVAAVTAGALVLAGALATAGVLLLDGDDEPAGKDRRQQAADTVPQGYLGTWEGTTTTANMGVPSSLKLTIKGGRVGENVARDSFTLLSFDCSSDWKLTEVKEDRLVFDTRWPKDHPNPYPGICSSGSDSTTLRLIGDGRLLYESGDEQAGRPRGELTRIDDTDEG